MSVENANLVDAYAQLFCGTASQLIATNGGFVPGSLTRPGAGRFVIVPVQKIAPAQGMAIAVNAAGSGTLVSGAIQPDMSILIIGTDAAGDPADPGEVNLLLFRFPTVA